MDDPEALALVKQPGSDGFRLDSAPLFQVAVGREWYIHTIYTVRSRDNANRRVGKRSVEYHSFTAANSTRRARRSARGVPTAAADIGTESSRGNNIVHISLDRSRQRAGSVGELAER
ncbi:FRAS1-related extracellular matrix protein 2-like [Electrophorus electricus]|uniref:FRAS1-related extracellular matrix protein 2-like n=1 Tax=Electrophorus electricus TaxID=8005 RepID=UPI0015CF8543|nr:FRAS1-related extracellular matrix protein 2-like [Electrophorus electricus]